VQEWKNLPGGDLSLKEKAQLIASIFVAETGVCQVNISSDHRNQMITLLQQDTIPTNIFDEALNALIVDMHQNSFRQFKNKYRKSPFSLQTRELLPPPSTNESLSSIPLHGKIASADNNV